jgi:acid phosphatase
VAKGDAWLRGFLPRLQRSAQLRDGAIFLAFDEADGGDTGGGGHIPFIAVGPTVRSHARSGAPLDHYSLLRTIEDAWGLPHLGRSASAPAISGIWK